MIGAAPMSSLLTRGVLAFLGNTTAATLSLTSFVASFISRSKKNLTVTTETPSEELDIILSMPPMADIASSILSVT